MEILEELEGKDIYIGSYDAGGHHYWLDNLKLPRLELEWHPNKYPSVTSTEPPSLEPSCSEGTAAHAPGSSLII